MSLMQRRKGRAFERRFARLLRASFPQCEVRRSSQADRAHNADVFVVGHPLLSRIWFELTDGRKPNPMAKLLQAERDIAAIPHADTRHLLPVVVWHRLGERQTQVTMRLGTFDAIRGALGQHHSLLVTMRVEEFLEMVK